MNTQIAEALNVASKAHGKQKRKYDGAPYFTHLLEVISLLAMVKADKNVLIAGLLHDAIEDTELNEQRIALMFGDKVKQLVTTLSDDKTLIMEERHAVTIEKMTNAGADVLNVKLADLLSNICAIPHDWAESKRNEYLTRCSDVIDAIVLNPAKKASDLLSLVTFAFTIQTEHVPLYDHISNWALTGKLYWSVTKSRFLHLPVNTFEAHEGTLVESNFSKLFELGLLHRFALMTNDAIAIRETSFLDGELNIVQNKHAVLHTCCLRVCIQ